MEYKYVDISDSVSIPVPKGLTPDEEASFIAGRIAFVNFEEVETQCVQAMQDLRDGKLVELRSVLAELEDEMQSENGKTMNINGSPP
jgi:hypothetical protein